MKHAVAIFVLMLAANCWGQGSNSLPWHIFTVTTNTVTNTYHPKQHRQTMVYATYPLQVEDIWVDGPAMTPDYTLGLGKQNERDNPDLRITECREIVTATLEWKGKPFSVELENTALWTRRERRIVEQPKERWEADQSVTGIVWGTVTTVTNATFTNTTVGADMIFTAQTSGLYRVNNGKIEPAIVDDLKEAK